jgi:hypothetical protein
VLRLSTEQLTRLAKEFVSKLLTSLFPSSENFFQLCRLIRNFRKLKSSNLQSVTFHIWITFWRHHDPKWIVKSFYIIKKGPHLFCAIFKWKCDSIVDVCTWAEGNNLSRVVLRLFQVLFWKKKVYFFFFKKNMDLKLKFIIEW